MDDESTGDIIMFFKDEYRLIILNLKGIFYVTKARTYTFQINYSKK